MGREGGKHALKLASRLIITVWDTLATFCRFHVGRGRDVPSQPLFHESVKTRMENPLLNYSPRVRLKEQQRDILHMKDNLECLLYPVRFVLYHLIQ